MPADLNELKRLHAAATQGEWSDLDQDWIHSKQLQAGDIVCERPDESCEESHAVWSANRSAIVALHNAFPALAAELEELRRENDSLRFRLAHGSADCVYCHLPAADMGKCERGFPGCARADDMMAVPMIDRSAIRAEAFNEAADMMMTLLAGEDAAERLACMADAEAAKREER